MPSGVFFRRALRDNLTGILAWGLGYGVLIMAVAFLYPSLQGSGFLLDVLARLGLLNALAVAPETGVLNSFAGYVAVQALAGGPLVLSVYAIPQALRAVSDEEARGTLDILLSAPVPRWRFLTEKALAVWVSLLGILLLMWLSMVVSAWLVPDEMLPLEQAVAGIWRLVPIMLVITNATLLLSVTVRNHRRAGGLAALFVLASYFMRGLLSVVRVEVLDFVKQFSIFWYYRPVAALALGFQWEVDVVLLVTAAALFALAVVGFQRRDLGV